MQMGRHVRLADRIVERRGLGATVPRDEPLSDLLERTDASLVFTDFPPDARIWGAGKHSFHVRDFEMGFRGSLRSMARLVRRCEGRYFAAFSPDSVEREP